MHELSIAMSIVEVTAQEAERREAAGVEAVHLRLGPLAGVVSEALRSAWELAREGSMLEGAALIIEEVPVIAHCPTCEADSGVISIQDLRCRVCGTPTPDLVQGREMEVTAMELSQARPDLSRAEG